MPNPNQLNAPALSLRTAPPPDPVEIEEKGVIHHPSTGEVRARIGMSASLYFFEGFRAEKRRALAEIAREYVALFPEGSSRIHLDGKRTVKFKTQHLDALKAKAESMDEDDLYYYAIQNSILENTYDMRQNFLMAFGMERNRADQRLSGLRIYMPPRFAFADLDGFCRLILQWADMLGAAHGTAGLGVQSSPGLVISDGVVEYDVLMAYPCLDFDDMGKFWSAIYFAKSWDKLRSSNWLTIVGDHHLSQLGGSSAIPQGSGAASIGVERYGSGVLLRAGAYPELGDARRSSIPEAYRRVANFVKPVRFEDYKYSLFAVPEGLNGGEVARAWIRRLD